MIIQRLGYNLSPVSWAASISLAVAQSNRYSQILLKRTPLAQAGGVRFIDA